MAGFTRSERLPYRQAKPPQVPASSMVRRRHGPRSRRDSSKQPVRKNAEPNECSADRHGHEENPKSSSGYFRLSLLCHSAPVDTLSSAVGVSLVTVCTPSMHRLWMPASLAWPLRCRAVCERPIDDQFPGGRGSTRRTPDHWGSPAMARHPRCGGLPRCRVRRPGRCRFTTGPGAAVG